jgi:type VI secretion system protein ImpA
MASQDTIELARMVAPVSETDPCGVDLRWDSVYDELRAARQQGDRSAFEGESSSGPNWHLVVDRASDVLAGRSKDLMIAGWLTEALLHLHGFAGVRDGLKAINGLIDNFWEQLYPRPDEGDWEPRIAPLVWLTEPDRGARLANLLLEIPLAPNSSGDGEVYSYNYWLSRSPKGGSGDDEEANLRRQAEAARKAKQFDDAVAVTPRDFFIAMLEAIQACQAEVIRFDQSLDRMLGREAPGTTAIRDALAKCEDLARRVVRAKGGLDETSLTEGEGEAGATSSGAGPGGPLKSREDAFRRLEEIAAFLRRTEPQSPIPYLIERAVAWGRLPFDQLLQELIKDQTSRGHVVELLGIKEVSQ